MKLYFENIENGSATVGYARIEIINHEAEIDPAELEAIRHFTTIGGAVISSSIPADVSEPIPLDEIIKPHFKNQKSGTAKEPHGGIAE